MWVSLVWGGFFGCCLLIFKFYFDVGLEALFWDFLWFVFLFLNVGTGFENRAFF